MLEIDIREHQFTSLVESITKNSFVVFKYMYD